MSGFLPRGRHLLADLHGVAPDRLTDPAAIETLLARQAEVLEEIMFDYSLHSENVRAILNPENDSE